MTVVEAANKFIPPSSLDFKLIKREYDTDDIVAAVLKTYAQSRNQLVRFAPFLKGVSIIETCRNIWTFWKRNIEYQVDPVRNQWAQQPKALWASKQGDCKSLSIAVACTLHALGIKGAFRFVEYPNPKMPERKFPGHVYVVVMYGGREIIIDCVWHTFNAEKKPYLNKWDYNMDKVGLYMVAGTGDEPEVTGYDETDLNISGIEGPNYTDAELALAIHKQRLALERRIVHGVHGIGSTHDDAYVIEMAAVDNAIAEIGRVTRGAKLLKKVICNRVPVSGAGEVGRVKPPRKTKPAKTAKKSKANQVVEKKKRGFVRKAVNVVKKGVKKVGKGLAKAVTLPGRLIAKGALEVTLPKSGYFFLYLFIKDPKILAQLPAKIKTKRAMQEKIAKLIVKKIGMKEAHFMGIVRNSVMKQFNDTPENVLATWMKALANKTGQQLFNIGAIPAVFAAAAPAIKNLLGKLGGGINEKIEQYGPNPEDWGIVSEENAPVVSELANMVQQQPDNNDPAAGRGSVPIKSPVQMVDEMNQAADNPAYTEPLGPLFKPGTNDSSSAAATGENTGTEDADPAMKVDEKLPQEGMNTPAADKLDNPKEDPKDGNGNNNGMLVALGVTALVIGGGMATRKKKAS